jgi:beta-lactamase class A
MFRHFAQLLARSLQLPLLSISADAIEWDATNQIAQIESETKSRMGVVAIDTQTRRRIEHRPDEKFLMCSTFKLLAVAAVLQQVIAAKKNWIASFVTPKRTSSSTLQ